MRGEEGRLAIKREIDNRERLYRRHRADLVDYAASITGDKEGAEDVVQSAWLRLDQKAAESIREPTAYLFRTVRNVAIDLLRRYQREARRYGGDVSDMAGLVAEDGPNQEAFALAVNELKHVQAALDALPEQTREAIRLHRIEGLPLRIVAERLGMSITRAHVLIAEGIAHCDRQRGRAGKRSKPHR